MKKPFIVAVLTITICAVISFVFCQYINFSNTLYNLLWDDCILFFLSLGLLSGTIIAKFASNKLINGSSIDKKIINKYRFLTFLANSVASTLTYFCFIRYIEKIDYRGLFKGGFDGIPIFCTSVIISSLIIFSFYKNSLKNNFSKFIKNVTIFLSFLVFLFYSTISVGCLFKFNELTYTWYDFENGVIIDGFQDTRIGEIIDSNIVFPNNIFGKNVIGIELEFETHNTNIQIGLPAQIHYPYLAVYIIDENGRHTKNKVFNGNIYLNNHNNQQNEFLNIENGNVIYEDKSVYIPVLASNYVNDLKISDKITDFYIASQEGLYYLNFVLSDKATLSVDDKNPYYNFDGNAFWDFKGIYSLSKVYVTPFNRLNKIIINNDNYNDDSTLVIVGEDVLVSIDKDFCNKNAHFIIIGTYKFEVDEDNMFYASDEYNLYDKDYTKLLVLTNPYAEIPNTLQNVDKTTFFIQNYGTYKGNTLCYENSTLFLKDSEKILYYDGYDDVINLFDNTEDVSDIIIDNLCNNNNLKVNWNDNFIIENGFVYNKTKEKLFFGDAKRKYLLIPKETNYISEPFLSRFNDYFVEVEDGNEFYEIYEGNLYSKGREKFLAVCNNYEDIDGKYATIKNDNIIIPKETQEITEEALSNMVTKTIIVDEENEHFEIYEYNLYTKGREMLLLIAGLKDDNNDFHIEKVDRQYEIKYYTIRYNDGHDKLIKFKNNNIYTKSIRIPAETKGFSSYVLTQLNGTFNDNIPNFYKEFIVNYENENFDSKDGCLYTENYKELLFTYGNGEFDHYNEYTIELPEKETNIGFANISPTYKIKWPK